ncbi:MAG: hypothetical protein ACI8PZ_001078 [Myxococcota bacterium]|jgi:hypothetical protein
MRIFAVLLAAALPATVLAAPSLALDGACPGPITIDVSGMTPSGDVVMLFSRLGAGTDAIPSGACAGTVTGLAGIRKGFKAPADDAGAMSMYPTLPDGACSSSIQFLDLATCELTPVGDLSDMSVGGGGVPEGCPQDWLVGTECNGADYGGGCTPEETGYHWKGYYAQDGQDYACWWHTKNQAWNDTPDTNFYQVAVNFDLTPGIGGSQWCYAFDTDPCASGACVSSPGGYFDIGNVGAWGWCGDGPFLSGGHMCIPVDPGLEASCAGGGGPIDGDVIDTWTPFVFADSAWKDGCAGGEKYVMSTGYVSAPYVGVTLCSADRYSIWLGETLDGVFYPVGDGCGSGEDQCEFVGGVHSSYSVDYSSNDGQPGFTRCTEFEAPVFGVLGGAHWTPSWQECGVTIP